MPGFSGEYLTTQQLAELLHIKERKVYDLAAAGEVPCSRVTGKLLFPRRQIEEWMARFPEFSLADPDAVAWSVGQIRGPRRLPLRLG